MSEKAKEHQSDPETEEPQRTESTESTESNDDDVIDFETLVREREELRQSWQRARADYQNLKRRTLSDIEAAVRRAESELLEHMLLVLDYLDMALAMECETQEAKTLHTGVEMTRSQLAGVLEKEGVQPIPTDGAFDPGVHQAVATIATEEHEPGLILETVRRGWTHRGNVLRFAQVKVSAPPQPIEGGSEDAPEAPDANGVDPT